MDTRQFFASQRHREMVVRWSNYYLLAMPVSTSPLQLQYVLSSYPHNGEGKVVLVFIPLVTLEIPLSNDAMTLKK